MAIQERNSEMVSLLSVDFIQKTDSAYLSGIANSAILSLPGLVAFWPMQVVDSDTLDPDYAYLPGRAGGQHLRGGTAAGDDLTLSSTAHATKGNLFFGNSTYDEVNNRLGIGTTAPASKLHWKDSPSVRSIMEYDDSASGYGEFAFRDGASSNIKWSIGVNADSASPANALYVFQYFNTSEGAVNLYRLVITNAGNVSIGGTGSFGSGVGVIYIANATTIPTTNPSGGGILYTDAGYLMYRGSAGSLTQLAVP